MAGKSTITTPDLALAMKQLRNARTEIVAPLQSVLLECAQDLEVEVEARAPRGLTGNLKRGIRSAMGRAQKTFLQAFTFTISKLAPHAHLVEFGTKPHKIAAKPGHSLFISAANMGNANKNLFIQEVNHPGARPVRFFRDAVASKRNSFKRKIESALNEALNMLNAQAA